MKRRAFLGAVMAGIGGGKTGPKETVWTFRYWLGLRLTRRVRGENFWEFERGLGVTERALEDQCMLCESGGHRAEEGMVRVVGDSGMEVFRMIWCPNCPVDWTFYERVGPVSESC